jgi:predicted DNA-binding transcriptional regulator YafY
MKKDLMNASTRKTLRTVLLAVLFHTYWPKRLTRDEITTHLSPLYGDKPRQALYRDLATLTGMRVENLLRPEDPGLLEWMAEQQRQRLLAITYDRQAGTFGLEQSLISIEITEDEARAFVALQEGFTPGVPYAKAVQMLLQRWAWLFSPHSLALVNRKRNRRARPVLLPLSPVEDYSKHHDTILRLDQAVEEGIYLSFDYTPLTRSWNDEPEHHERVEPFELEYRDGHWYFTGHLPDRDTFLDYRVDRIHPATLQPDHDHFLPGTRRRPGVKIRYWVSPQLARRESLSIRLREQHVALLDHDQGAIVEGYAKSLWWAMRLLLGYGEQVKALEPEELVEILRRASAALFHLYHSDGSTSEGDREPKGEEA